jgi:hypothetical protein
LFINAPVSHVLYYKYTSSYKYNNMDVMASMMLKYSWLKFVDMSSFTICAVVMYADIYMNVLNPEGSINVVQI